MKKAQLLLSVLLVVLVAAAWKWSLVLEERLAKRLEKGQPLRLKIAQGTFGITRFAMPLTDGFSLSISDLSGYKSGYTSEQWRVEQLKFRPSAAQIWKLLPASRYRSNWRFFRRLGEDFPRVGEQRKLFSIFDGSAKSDLLPGQYGIRSRFDCEFHDNRSGIRYVGAGTFQFNFHINPASRGKRRVVLDGVREVTASKPQKVS